MISIESIFHESIPKVMEGFEIRDSQIQMSKEVGSTIQNGGSLIVEAGTGVGKSLAYLIPAALFAIKNNSLVVISTETKALQDQLIKKDIPLLRKILNQDIRAEIAMGASNYLCKRKFESMEDQGMVDIDIIHQYDAFSQWAKTTKTGIRSEYPGNIPLEYWFKVSRESDNCLGKACKNFQSSFYFLEKEKWKNCHLLIVNHSLLSSHIAGNFRLLPDFKRLIVDEAHNFPDIMGKSFQSEITYDFIHKLLNFIHSKGNKISLLGRMNYPQSIVEITETSKENLLNLFGRIPEEIKYNPYGPERIKSRLKIDDGKFEEGIKILVNELLQKSEKYSMESEVQEEKEIAQGIEMATGRLKGINDFFHELRNRSNGNLVYWSEPPNQRKNERFLKLLSQPINVDEIIGELLMPSMSSLVFTSATLTSQKKDFTYFQNQLGSPIQNTIQLSSPFEYKKQAILYIPKGIRDPNENPDGYHKDIIEKIKHLINLTQGNCFVLFTSNKSLNQVRLALESQIEYNIYSQTTLGAVNAKKFFLDNRNSVLFGVNSFWQGVDIKGEQLKNVIITKLPFQVPTEPVLETKIEIMKENRQNPFREFQLPRACILLKQGFGRLIRSHQDTGIVSILDPRIHTKSYGKTFLEIFPEGIKTVENEKELESCYKNLPKIKT